MTNANDDSDAGLRLYHAPSSYYSMIARMALAEGGVAYQPVFVDIHFRMSQQQPDYVRVNPGMTVPTLVGRDLVLRESREIAEYAFGLSDSAIDTETRRWLDLHYSYPIEELTFGSLLSRNPIARFMIPRRLAAARRQMLNMVSTHPDLASAYAARAAAFGARIETFKPEAVQALAQRRRVEAIAFLDQLEACLSDGREALAPPRFGVADVAWTVFLARMEFAGLGCETERRPALARYWRAAQSRPSFARADIWKRLYVGRLIAGAVGLAR